MEISQVAHPRLCHLRACMVSRLRKNIFQARSNNIQTQVSQQTQLQTQDQFVGQITNLTKPLQNGSLLPIQSMVDECQEVASTLSMPTTRDEEYRFTDIKYITQASIADPQPPSRQQIDDILSMHELSDANACRVVVINGIVDNELTIQFSSQSQGVKVTNLSSCSQTASRRIGEQSRVRGGPFATLNGVHVSDVVCIEIEQGVKCTSPIHILYVQNGMRQSAMSYCSPRLVLIANEDSQAEIIEEFVTIAEGSNSQHTTNQVAEFFLGARADIRHGVVQMISESAACMKCTLVEQCDQSNYSIFEACVGGKLVRHDLKIEQIGKETSTLMRQFILCGANSVHDLHSKLRLNHPFGEADQLHKCIVTHSSGRGVFDGNVKVERQAQKTDAKQLSRNLLLVPKATVNVKPNLQIIADDVKCTHGCAVSDLSDEEIFYLQSRGIDKEMARQALVYSFGKEIVQEFGYESISKRVQQRVDDTLKMVDLQQD
eukprot:TRINITY_DN5327_c0_g1_i2.p1 TRINITY_DN5327_c0_g1~~TRINITY_DN5327_c0_g1_i2.p1  ORF type:complete len:488 (+),score=37.20 TRINITY_DN5327_c0_g1_i2:176-1639(+)